MEPFIGPSKADYSQENEMDTKVLHDKRLQVIMATLEVSKRGAVKTTSDQETKK